MSDFKAKMHKFRFPLWKLTAVFKGPISKGRKGKREGRGTKREREGKRRAKGAPKYFGQKPPLPLEYTCSEHVSSVLVL